MSNTDEGKPAGKSGQRSRKGDRGKKTVSKKRPPESPAPVQLQSPDQDHTTAAAGSRREPEDGRSRRPSPSRLPSPRRPSRCRRRLLRPRRPLSPHRPSPYRPHLDCQNLLAKPRNGRTRTGDLADHHERLSRLHQEIVRGFRVVFRAAQRRSVARQGDVGSHRIREAGLRDFRRRVAEDLRTPQPARQANPPTPSRLGRQGAGNARQVLRRCAIGLCAVARKQEAPVFRSFLRYLGMGEIDQVRRTRNAR